jgi:hypothetical protein
MRAASALIALTLTFAASGCRDGGDSKTPLSAVVPNGSATTPTFARTPQTATPQTPPDEAPAEPADDELSGEDDAQEAAEPEAPAEPEKEAPLPDVVVKNVGMHIGGEKNTAAQKRPIRAEVSKHYDDMKRCYAKASDPPKTATFGVDMRIEGEGGNPKITNPRSGLKGEGVKECLVSVFESITFPRQPRGVARMVSYSIEFRR